MITAMNVVDMGTTIAWIKVGSLCVTVSPARLVDMMKKNENNEENLEAVIEKEQK